MSQAEPHNLNVNSKFRTRLPAWAAGSSDAGPRCPLPIAAGPAARPVVSARDAFDVACWAGVLIGRRRRDAPAVGGAPHRRHFAHPKRPARARSSSTGPFSWSAIRSTSATSCSGSVSRSAPGCSGWLPLIVAAARARVPRHRPVGGTAARVAAGRRLPRLRGAGAAVDSSGRAAAVTASKQERQPPGSRGARRCSANAAR